MSRVELSFHKKTNERKTRNEWAEKLNLLIKPNHNKNIKSQQEKQTGLCMSVYIIYIYINLHLSEEKLSDFTLDSFGKIQLVICLLRVKIFFTNDIDSIIYDLECSTENFIHR